MAFVIDFASSVTICDGTASYPALRVLTFHSFCKQVRSGFIVGVKKTFWYSNVFFYNHLYRNSVFRNIIMKSGIKPLLPQINSVAFQNAVWKQVDKSGRTSEEQAAGSIINLARVGDKKIFFGPRSGNVHQPQLFFQFFLIV